MKKKLNYILIGIFVLSSVGCAVAPKPTSMVELQDDLKNPNIQSVRSISQAEPFIAEARKYEKLAEQSYAQKDIIDAREYGLLGTLKLRTAQAIYQRSKDQKVFDQSTADMKKYNETLEKLNQQRTSLLNDISSLNQQLIKVRRQTALANTAKKPAVVATDNTPTTNGLSWEDSVKLKNLLKQAHDAQDKAAKVSADKFAPESYNLSYNRLRSIESALAHNHSTPDMLSELVDIIAGFKQAYIDASPAFQNASDRSDVSGRRDALRQDISSYLDPSEYQETSGGVLIILPGLFSSKSAYLDDAGRSRIDKLAQILKKYDDFSILIDGFSSKSGKPTESLSTSQIRARQVAKVLEDAGISESSIETDGLGATDFRYSPRSNQNDRVEISVQRF